MQAAPLTAALFNTYSIIHQNQGSAACGITWLQSTFDGTSWEPHSLGYLAVQKGPCPSLPKGVCVQEVPNSQMPDKHKHIPIPTHHKLSPLPWRLWSTMSSAGQIYRILLCLKQKSKVKVCPYTFVVIPRHNMQLGTIAKDFYFNLLQNLKYCFSEYRKSNVGHGSSQGFQGHTIY